MDERHECAGGADVMVVTTADRHNEGDDRARYACERGGCGAVYMCCMDTAVGIVALDIGGATATVINMRRVRSCWLV